MHKILLVLYLSLLLLGSCDKVQPETTQITQKKINQPDTAPFNGLRGTWVRHDDNHFIILEIQDTSHVSYYELLDRKSDTESGGRYWYYKSAARMGYWDKTRLIPDMDIWVSTDKFRFDYKIKGDTLIEIDKMGEQGKLIRVYSDN
ncbi:MAG: hypothetical protein IPM69_17205 [Ignavibacteria bacterium]|nr:hypothetical protein [Ignavibacteria bacterium]